MQNVSFDLDQWIQLDLSHTYFLLLLSWTYSVLISLVQKHLIRKEILIKESKQGIFTFLYFKTYVIINRFNIFLISTKTKPPNWIRVWLFLSKNCASHGQFGQNCQETKRKTASGFPTDRNTKSHRKPKNKTFRPEEKFNVVFFRPLALSFGIGTDGSFCYEVDTPTGLTILFFPTAKKSSGNC